MKQFLVFVQRKRSGGGGSGPPGSNLSRIGTATEIERDNVRRLLCTHAFHIRTVEVAYKDDQGTGFQMPGSGQKKIKLPEVCVQIKNWITLLTNDCFRFVQYRRRYHTDSWVNGHGSSLEKKFKKKY
jgi:hypothetical protein